MDIRKAFEEGRFLDIASTADSSATPEERLMLGISLFKLGRDNDALNIFDEITTKVEELVKAYYYMALIYRQRGEMDVAQQYLERYSSIHPDDDDAHDIIQRPGDTESLMNEPSPELARIYASQGHFEQALEIYSHILSISDQTPEVQDEARYAQNMYVMKTLETWLERLRK